MPLFLCVFDKIIIDIASVVCGRSNRAARLVGGEHTDSHEFPWLANIHINSKSLVNGALINDRYVLTAASQLVGLVQTEIFNITIKHNNHTLVIIAERINYRI